MMATPAKRALCSHRFLRWRWSIFRSSPIQLARPRSGADVLSGGPDRIVSEWGTGQCSPQFLAIRDESIRKLRCFALSGGCSAPAFCVVARSALLPLGLHSVFFTEESEGPLHILFRHAERFLNLLGSGAGLVLEGSDDFLLDRFQVGCSATDALATFGSFRRSWRTFTTAPDARGDDIRGRGETLTAQGGEEGLSGLFDEESAQLGDETIDCFLNSVFSHGGLLPAAQSGVKYVVLALVEGGGGHWEPHQLFKKIIEARGNGFGDGPSSLM